ncbi:ASCH domain-containing protein [Kitasatospora purpeofusca]|uniref:ASCH domain-containing protein n=1 Tax=Kitasatospora purpeofusca TaxID=67352 RepID=UPI002A5AC7C9|nr:ASCH domain-containing protein [Kitasatospora purpeofusca]MDY0810723.1 ASCH domain-containing protein [Kitasatospora purpeofusca]
MTTPTLKSPNTVLANAVDDAVDVLRPRIGDSDIESIDFSVGTQINGQPHVGTHLVQSLAFLLAERARDEFGVDTSVDFCALDNSPAETVRAENRRYQRAFAHSLSADEITALVARHYLPLFDACRTRTNVPYTVSTYTQQQDTPAFRAEFLRTLELLEEVGTWLSPNSGSAHIRLPCPVCGWAEKYADRTRLVELDEAGGLFEAHCFEHGHYEADITPLGGGYLDLATLYRNVVKERSYRPDDRTLHVMVKGGDWAFGCQLVDGAHAALGLPVGPLPVRIFTPQILGSDGGKLSKSLLREAAELGLTQDENTPAWVLDPSAWPGTQEDYVDALTGLGELVLSDPKHFFRSYTTTALETLMSTRQPAPHNSQAKRPRTMPIYRQYFDLIAKGEKTVEVRVGYESMKRIKAGDLINFTCRESNCLTRVTRVGRYRTFTEMFGTERVEAVNPHATEIEQLEAIRAIFPPHKEALGVLTFEIERVDHA